LKHRLQTYLLWYQVASRVEAWIETMDLNVVVPTLPNVASRVEAWIETTLCPSRARVAVASRVEAWIET